MINNNRNWYEIPDDEYFTNIKEVIEDFKYRNSHIWKISLDNAKKYLEDNFIIYKVD